MFSLTSATRKTVPGRGRVYTLDKAVTSGLGKSNKLRLVKSVNLTPPLVRSVL
jgi:hypothetical protein